MTQNCNFVQIAEDDASPSSDTKEETGVSSSSSAPLADTAHTIVDHLEVKFASKTEVTSPIMEQIKESNEGQGNILELKGKKNCLLWGSLNSQLSGQHC